MSQRTSFRQQFDAIAELSRQSNDPALQDAAHTLSLVRRIDEELHSEPPDQDEVEKFLMALFVG